MINGDSCSSSDDDHAYYECDSTSSDNSFYSSASSLNSALDCTFSQHSKSFNVIHINAQSIPAHYTDLMSSFNVANIHAILVSETFLKPNLPSTSFALPGFHLIRNDRTGKGGGGVAIYLRSQIPFSILDKSPSPYTENSEHIFVEVLFGTLKLLLGVFYSPSLRIDYFNEFESLVEKYVPEVDHTIIMGDFNTCLVKNDSRSNRLINIIDSANLNILNSKHATHFFPNCTPSLLDLMIVSSTERVNTYGQLPAEAFSYHDLIYLSYKIRPPKKKPTVLMRRSFKNFDNSNFMNDLSQIDWNSVLNATSTNDKVNIFNSILIELFDKHAPLRPIKIKHLPAPWLTEDIRAMMVKRNKAKAKYKHNPTAENFQRYKSLRNKCSKLCRMAQREYIHDSVENKDPGKVWKFLDSMGIGRERKSNSIPSNIDINLLNRHFTTVPVIDSLAKRSTLNSLSLRPLPSSIPFKFTPITAMEIKKHILAIKSDAIGSDGVSRKMILLALDDILSILCHIFNHSLSYNTFPNIWCSAHVIPIPKITNPSAFSHYRPISILPFLSKVLERVVHGQISCYLSRYNLLSPFQSGFRPGHSTVTALIKICDDIRYGIDRQQVSILALLDFSNAFNTVDFDILLAILKSINISPNVISWFRSYLYDRRQCIRINDNYSSCCCLNAGVPQGGVLSPLLFSIFINSITDLLSLSFHLYADDLQIYTTTSVDDFHNTITKLNSDLNTISAWSKSNGLSVNANKSQVSIFGSRQQLSKVFASSPSPVNFDGTTLDFHDTVKNLGVIMDNSFSWSPQITEVSRKIYAVIGRLRRWKNFLPIRTKISLAQSLLHPLLDYADSCYTDLSQTLLNKLERLQNMIIRFVFGLKKFDRITPYRIQLKWLTIKQRRNLHILSLLYSILFLPHTPLYLKERFTFLGSDHGLHLRSKCDNKLKTPRSRSQCYGDSFTVKATILWNTLPRDIRNSESLYTFKHRLKNHYLMQL